ncbi:MAG: YncE family protein [marine benthic group bacterium]|nr:YncE family protein [Gemmatimonadota bacterium]
MIRIGCRTLLVVTVVSAAMAGPSVAQEPPQADYYVYVAAESQDEVALVRFGPGGAEVSRTIEASLNPTDIDGPHGIAVSPDGSNWYVSIAHGLPFGQIQRFATGSDRKLGAAQVGLFPATMSVTPGGLLFAVNFNLHGDPVPSSVSVVETGSMTEIRKVTTCAMPHGSKLSPDARRHYSVCMMDDQLVEIDVPSLDVSRRLYLEPGAERDLPPGTAESSSAVGNRPGSGGTARCGPTWVQPSPDGGRAWIACNKNREVLEVDLDAWQVTRRFATGAGPYNLDVTPDGTTLVVTYKGDHAVGLFALADGSERAVVPSSRRIPHGVAVSPDSRYAFITVEGVANDPGTVDVIDLETGTLAASVDVGRQAGGIGFWKMERKQDRK